MSFEILWISFKKIDIFYEMRPSLNGIERKEGGEKYHIFVL